MKKKMSFAKLTLILVVAAMAQSVIFLFLILFAPSIFVAFAFFAIMALSILAAAVFSIIGIAKNKIIIKIIPIIEVIISIGLGTFEVIYSQYFFLIRGLAESQRQEYNYYKELYGTPEKFLSSDNSNYYIFYYPEDPESEHRRGVRKYDNDGLLKNRLLSIDFYESGKSKYRDGEKYITYYMRYGDFTYLRLEEDGDAFICVDNDDIFGGNYYYYYSYDSSYFDELYQIQALIINQDL